MKNVLKLTFAANTYIVDIINPYNQGCVTLFLSKIKDEAESIWLHLQDVLEVEVVNTLID